MATAAAPTHAGAPGTKPAPGAPACSPSGGADAAARDAGRDDPDEQLPVARRPGLDARAAGCVELGFLNMASGPLDEHAPTALGREVDVIDLERHLVGGVGDPGPKVLVQRPVLSGTEHDRPALKLVVDGQHGGPEPADVGDPADPSLPDEAQALVLVKLFHHPVSHRGAPSRHGTTWPGRPSLDPSHARSAGDETFGPHPGTFGLCPRLERGARLESTARHRSETAMYALVYHGPGQKAWEEVPDPEIIDENHAIIRVDATPICGTDLRILAGDVPEVRAGRILGHEAVGTVDEVGDNVHRLSPGDRVLVSCISACGTCQYCREGRYGQCLDEGGWVLGHRIDGTQAEYVRVPYADTSTYRIPDGVSDDAMLMLADILPTGYEVGVLAGGVRPGDVVAVVGAGPVGLAAIASARLFSPSRIVAVDLADARLEAARHFGADVTVNDEREDPMTVIKDLTGRLGADVAIEAAGTAATFEMAVRLARPGGRIANIGVHGGAAVLHLEEQWARDITITTGQVDGSSTPTLMRLVASGQLDAARFVTHHFDLNDFEKAYDVFANPEASAALKVVLTRGEAGKG